MTQDRPSLSEKRFIFTVTTGRTGTGYLAHLLGIFRDTLTFHEPDPSYVICLRQAQADREVARTFLLETKLPAISRQAVRPIYIETSHLFCKGFLEPWLEIPALPVPDLILLERNLREVSLSFLSLHDVPGRSENGLRFLLAPWDPTCLTCLEGWQSMTDYQLLYWYCLEIEERKKHYRAMILERGGRCLHTSIEQIQSISGILTIGKGLALRPLTVRGWLAYFRRRNSRINPKSASKEEVEFDPQQLQDWEDEVKQRLVVKL
jgi:hypothetical protein